MSPWVKVVTHPIGLAGFALFLIFGYLSRRTAVTTRVGARRAHTAQPSWQTPALFGIAALALVGGLLLAYAQTRVVPPPVAPSASAPSGAPQIKVEKLNVETKGNNSPATGIVIGNAEPPKPAPGQPSSVKPQ
jgi:hypothetical protein